MGLGVHGRIELHVLEAAEEEHLLSSVIVTIPPQLMEVLKSTKY